MPRERVASEIAPETLTDSEIRCLLAVFNKELDVIAGSLNWLARQRDELLAQQEKRRKRASAT